MSSDDRGCSRPIESERKGRKDGESERGVVCHLFKKRKRQERANFTTALERKKDSHAPRNNKSSVKHPTPV